MGPNELSLVCYSKVTWFWLVEITLISVWGIEFELGFLCVAEINLFVSGHQN